MKDGVRGHLEFTAEPAVSVCNPPEAALGSDVLRRPALFALMSALFATAVGYGVVLPVLPFLVGRLPEVADVAAASRHTGLLTGTYTLALFLLSPVWGRLSDRHGRRRVLLLGLGGFAVTLPLFAVAESLPLLYLSRLLSGSFASAVAPVVYAHVADHAPTKEWRAHHFALLNIAGTAGFFVGPVVGGLALLAARALFAGGAAVGFLAPFLATSLLTVLAGVAVRTFMPTKVGLHATPAATAKTGNDRTLIVRLLSISFVTALAVGAFEVGLALRGKQVLNLNAYQIGMMFTECSLVMFVVQALVFSPLVKPDLTRRFMTPGLVILAAGLAAVPFAGGYIAMTLAVALIAASAGLLSPIATYWTSLAAGETQGTELGRQTAAASLGQAIGSAAGGMLFDVVIVPNASFTLTAALVAVGLAASAGLSKRLDALSTATASGVGTDTKAAGGH